VELRGVEPLASYMRSIKKACYIVGFMLFTPLLLPLFHFVSLLMS
jgi:hypothetical protein